MKKTWSQSLIEPKVWETFYKKLYPPSLYDNTVYFGVLHPVLDLEITLNE
jgi:hypothetical protein